MRWRAVAAALLGSALLAAAQAEPSKPGTTALAAVRQQCVAAARDAQEHGRAVTALTHRIALRQQDAAAIKRDLEDSRPEQARFLGTLAFFAKNLENPLIAASLPPAERSRGQFLIHTMVPAMQAQGHALAAEVERLARLPADIAKDRQELGSAQAALDADRRRLAQLLPQRLELTRPTLPTDAVSARRAESVKSVDELIKLADDTVGQDDGDTMRPAALRAFDPPQSTLTPPVSGAVGERFGSTDSTVEASQGIQLAAPPAGVVVAPFDGQVVYAGPFRNLGLVLIVQHGRLYHSLLAGLGRIDASVGEWVLAGEPVGVMPAAAQGSGGGPSLYFELRREGRPVDPQPWLASEDTAPKAPDEDEKVRQ